MVPNMNMYRYEIFKHIHDPFGGTSTCTMVDRGSVGLDGVSALCFQPVGH